MKVKTGGTARAPIQGVSYSGAGQRKVLFAMGERSNRRGETPVVTVYLQIAPEGRQGEKRHKATRSIIPGEGKGMLRVIEGQQRRMGLIETEYL